LQDYCNDQDCTKKAGLGNEELWAKNDEGFESIRKGQNGIQRRDANKETPFWAAVQS
jgi:hypothetical protein